MPFDYDIAFDRAADFDFSEETDFEIVEEAKAQGVRFWSDEDGERD